ncbi:MAG: (E)-4-hydroxy-3-methylbut-2-enyl-diphosphate synthase, partial [Bacteroidales bacterium]|nr:(E)-4-hydroxy-3-methylbut-2-enyl-diphosphate synthase [Bacteroidales bacterium]
KLTSLVKNCKIHQTAIRVGVNHGSLSERIVSKYGDTAQGMTESAMEFIRIFKDLGFTNLVISLKASNVLVMVDSNRLLIKKMKAENSFYPLHLGVTEAGNAEEGRIKSALGIGSLLSEGIGNTIRVSLTEEAEYEIPVAKKIVEAALENQWENDDFDLPIQYQRKESYGIYNIGNQQLPIVVNHQHNDHSSNLNADYIFDPASNSLTSTDQKNNLRNCNIEDLINSKLNSDQQYFLNIAPNQWTDQLIKSLVQSKNILLVIEKKDSITLTEIIQLLEKIEKNNISCPIIFRINCLKSNIENLMIHASIIAAPLLLAAKLDGIWIDSPTFSSTEISFGILQASRQRISKTEYIACPSCGRTLFNIQKKLEEIKKETTDLVGLKIAIMGCIVNGPGEMADADYGYVGAGPNQVNIYKGHQIIKKNVAEDEATKVLLEIIRSEV